MRYNSVKYEYKVFIVGFHPFIGFSINASLSSIIENKNEL